MKKLVLQVLIILWSVNSFALESGKVDITSDKLEVDKESETALFSGNVESLYQDIILNADKLKVFYDSKSKNKDEKIKLITAKGDVHVVQNSDIIDADEAIYKIREDLIIFKNNVTLNRDGNILKGDYLTVDVKTKKAEMKSGKNKRVKAVYFQKTNAKK